VSATTPLLTELLYRDDPDLLEFEARVIARLTHDGRPAVVLDRTAFYPEGGGQPWDTGTLDGVSVVAVVKRPDAVVHVLEQPLEAERVRGRVDAARRRDHRQQHHGQHLLSRAFEETAGANTVSFHLGTQVSTIDLDRPVSLAEVQTAEDRTNQIVWQGRPVRVRTVSRAEAVALGVEPPADAGDSVRLVEAEGFDLQPCGGTHPRNTADVGVVLAFEHEPYKGGTRVRFVCGQRAVEAARRRTQVLGRLGALLSSPVDELDGAATRLVEERAEAARREKDLTNRLLTVEAQRLIGLSSPAATGPVAGVALVTAVYDGWTPADIRSLAQRVIALTPSVALLASRSEKAHLVFAQSDGLGHDLSALLQEALRALGGRGGGRGNLVQGGSDRVEGVDAALTAAAARLRDAGGQGRA
jgi:alanyl-tRNA synthetase